ncbi:MAG TPA: hypothetical protein PK812_08360 [Beijerinckiaceae bacterium]|nr:hypothetical protein [Beijerinckiaceae bacterium]
MPLSRVVLSACLNAFAGLNALAAILLAVLGVLRLVEAGPGGQAVQAAVHAAGFAAGAFVCRWAARKIAAL